MAKITIADVARELGQNPQTTRVFIRAGVYPFAVAMKIPGSKHYTYTIFPEKYREYINNGGKPITDHIRVVES